MAVSDRVATLLTTIEPNAKLHDWRTDLEAPVAATPAVDKLLDQSIPLARTVFDELFRRFPNATITVDADSIGLGTAPGYKGLVFTILPHKNHVTIGFYRGTELPDPTELLEGSGKVHRHVKIRTEADLYRPDLLTLISAALSRAGIEPA